MAAAVLRGASSAANIMGGATHLRSPATTSSAFLLLQPLPLPRRSSLPLVTTTTTLLPESRGFANHRIRATSSEETSGSVQVEEIFSDLKEKWDGLENKSTVVIYGGGAIVAVWLSSIVIGAINSVPLLPKIMELVGLGYTGWFVYRYLLFKSNRKELATDIEDLKKKIAGTGE